MIKRLAATIDKRNWRTRIEYARVGFPSASCGNLHFYEDDECLIRFRKAGTGPKLVLVCDPPATLEAYDQLIEILKDSFTVFAFELPGNGFSVPKPDYSFEFQPTNNAVARFLRACVGEGAILAFSCGACYAALDIAARYPELCASLVLMQAPSWKEELKWKKGRDATGIIGVPFLGQLVFPRMMVPRAPAWFQLCMGVPAAIDHCSTCAAAAFEHGGTFCLPTMFQSYLIGKQTPFERPEQPALVIWGTLDGSHAATDKSSSKELAKNVELVALDNVGHFPELENPMQFKGILQKHLA